MLHSKGTVLSCRPSAAFPTESTAQPERLSRRAPSLNDSLKSLSDLASGVVAVDAFHQEFIVIGVRVADVRPHRQGHGSVVQALAAYS